MLRGVVFVLLAACSYDRPASSSQPEEAGVHIDAPVPPDPDAPPPGDGQPPDAALPPDAPASNCDATACAGITGTCQGDECVVTVTAAGSLACPNNLTCRFVCNSGNACKSTIDCSQADGCTIDCTQMNACQGAQVNCTGPGCTVYCRATNTCTNMTFTCGNGNSRCDLECCPATSCGQNLQFTGMHTTNSPGTCP